MQNPFLIGTRVYLRPLGLEDAAPLTTWLNDPEVRRHLRAHHPPLTLLAEESFLRKLGESDSDVVLGIVARETDQLLGGTGLHQIDFRNRHVQFGIFLGDKSAWGKGYGTQATRLIVRHAFDTLNMHRVGLRVYEDNHRAQHVYEKVGFRIEGRLRQDTFRDGRYWDTIVMAVLRAEWKTVDHTEGG